MQILAKFITTYVISVGANLVDDYNVFQLKESVSLKSGIPGCFIDVAINGKHLEDIDLIVSDKSNHDFIAVNL